MTQIVKSSITDIPRLAGEIDQFGIDPFEKGLVRFIENTNTPITIALQGEWGSGKASLMNTLRRELAENDHSNFHSIWLNTWEFALMNDTRSTLFQIISQLIDSTIHIASQGKSNNERCQERILKLTTGFTKFITKTAANKIIEGAGDEIDKMFTGENNSSINEIRDQLEAIISECIARDSKEGFIFFIDDLDRIDPPAAVELLELLKNIFTLKNCVFVLAIDYDVVVKGLEPKFGKLSESNEREFRSFFDKIIQVPFSMPVSNYQIDDFLKESLINTNYLTSELANNKELIGKFSEVANLTVGTNPRSLKRLMNSLSLISCINTARGMDEENDQLNEELELLVNFALVSIQIAYPAVYRLLTLHSAFDKWNESVALRMNLKELDEKSKEKLNKSEEFDEEWEQVLFRLCENDYFLKKKSLNISRLLNTLKNAISENGDSVEDIIESVISLSSVTNIEAFDKPVIDYHRGSLLKSIRELMLPILREKFTPDLAKFIGQQGKKVQTNLTIKFTENNWEHWVQLSSHPFEGRIRLIIKTSHGVSPQKSNNFEKVMSDAGTLTEYNSLLEDFRSLTQRHPQFNDHPVYEDFGKSKGYFHLAIFAYMIKPTINDFKTEESIKAITEVIFDLYNIRQRLKAVDSKTKNFYDNVN